MAKPIDDKGEKPPTSAPDKGDEGDELEKAQAQVEHWRKQARTWETRATENADASEKLKAIEDRDKSELQKLTDRATEATQKAEAAEARAVQAELNVTRIRVGAEKGLTPSQAARLVGDDEDALKKDADELIASFPPADPDGKRPAPTRPTPSLRGGDDPDVEPDETDPIKLVESVPR